MSVRTIRIRFRGTYRRPLQNKQSAGKTLQTSRFPDAFHDRLNSSAGSAIMWQHYVDYVLRETTV